MSIQISGVGQLIDQEEIYKQCFSDNPAERVEALIQLRDNCSLLPDKERIWRNLYRLISDELTYIRFSAVEALGTVFQYMPDKKQSWNELIKLTTDEDYNVRDRVSSVIGSTFSQVPDKQQAWNDLHELINNKDDFVRAFASKAICCAFSDIPDKQQAWNDLSKLTTGEDGDFGLHTYHTLGKISITNACKVETEADYKKEFEKAIEFFEKEVQVLHFGWDSDDPGFENPSEFCLPYYRSLYAIVFKKQEAKEEVDKSLAEMKKIICGSRSKESLFKAVENLANSLKEVLKLENMDLEAMKSELNFYSIYLDRVAEIMKDVEETAPCAVEVMRRGLPILDRNLKKLIEEIQNKAKIACQVSQGTPTQEIACAVSKEVQKWDIGSQEEMTQSIENLAYILEEKVSVQPNNQYILSKINQMKIEKDLVHQYEILAQIIPLIRNVTVVPVEPILDEIKELKASVDKLTTSIDKLPNSQEYLDMIQMHLKEIKDYMPGMQEKIDEVLYELYTPLSTTQKLKIAIPIIPSLVSYEQETDVPEFVAENIHELKNLFYKMRDLLKKLR